MATNRSTSDQIPVSRRSSLAASVGAGVLAVTVGYLVTYLLVSGEVRDVFGDDVATWKGVAWYFYEAHLVDIQASSQVGSLGGTSTLDLIAQSESAGAGLLYVLPPLVLLAAGGLLAVRWNATDLGEAVVVGAPVAIGYGAVVGLGAVITEASARGSAFGIEVTASTSPELLPAVVLGGVLYPLVFATAGAVLAAALAMR
ncbi:hypothetical protein [Natrinema sp. 74]|uniref:hypothetical protein n=1 Tax=Natrinema sp. 74 TaxID=3384159 RepID=UPI0038D48A73